MHERTKRSQIPRKVKKAVYTRDRERCVLCGRWVPEECACCHFISRARLGLGIEENIVTLCHECHYNLDNGEIGRKELRAYLESQYPGWNERKETYTKWPK
jgi:5-methylcytosine-specific restriction endonuclease McrA